MAKFTPAYLKKLEDLLEGCGYDVRYEKGNFKSNHCLIEAKKVVVINKFSVLESRIQSLLEIIQTLNSQGVIQVDLRTIGLKNPIHSTGTFELPEGQDQAVSAEITEDENRESGEKRDPQTPDPVIRITFLGTGTSQGVPVIACDCEVCTSKDPRDNRLRTSILVEDEHTTVVIDSGPDFRYQMLRAGVKKLDGLLFTHEHKDHIAGMDDIRAFNYICKKPVDIYATEQVQHAIKREFHYAFDAIKYPGVPELHLHTIENKPFNIGTLTFTPILVKHFLLDIFGFRIGDFTYITDAKTIPEEEHSKIFGSKVLVLNALRREPHVSHLTLDEALEMMTRFKPETGLLTHLSHQMGLHESVEKELPQNVRIAYDGMVLEFQ